MWLLFQTVTTRGIQLQFPRAGIIMSVGTNGFRHVVVIQLADTTGEVSLEPEGLRQAVVGGNRLTKNLRVRQYPGAVGIQAREHGISAWAT